MFIRIKLNDIYRSVSYPSIPSSRKSIYKGQNKGHLPGLNEMLLSFSILFFNNIYEKTFARIKTKKILQDQKEKLLLYLNKEHFTG